MVYDRIEALEKYIPLNPHIRQVIDYLNAHTTEELLALPVGRHEIDGDRCVIMRQSFDAMPVDDKGYELHRTYTDLQIVLKGIESCYVESVEDPGIYPGYKAEGDICMYFPKPDGKITLYPGVFALLQPTDGHMPQRQHNGEQCHVEKLCIKLMNDQA